MDSSPELMVSSACQIVSSQIELCGRLQGLGVRPAIARLAVSLQLSGCVSNTSDGIRIEIEGNEQNTVEFQHLFQAVLPSGASVRDMRVTQIQARGYRDFQIVAAESTGPLSAEVPLDTAVCATCLRDIEENQNLRFRYALTACASCGPRYSVLLGMPYSRQLTSMHEFPLCCECQSEFEEPRDRRFHAETIACARCGPGLQYINWQSGEQAANEMTGDAAALNAGSELLLSGGILLLKGIGGYQLVCDATNEQTVLRLRAAKNRLRKPLAVMMTRSDFDRHFSNAGAAAESCLSPLNPIVIAEVFQLSGLAASIAPGITARGVFLPSSPLHALLLEAVERPLVVTSGNREGEPIEYSDERAIQNLRVISDGCLKHNRTIVRPVDDSVVRIVGNRSVTIRAGRGLTPATLPLPACGRSVLAVGGEQKVAIVVSNGQQVVCGPHIGDLRTVASRTRFRSEVQSLLSLYGCQPEVIACDLHPDYFTSQWAEEQGVRVHRVQHHHAHIASGMAEHSLLDQPVLGIAFDGTGFGDDGTVWGGEFLIATRNHYQRIAGLRPFALPGGEKAVQDVWRIAGSLMREAFPEWSVEEVAEFLCQRATGRLEGLQHAISSFSFVTSVLHDQILKSSIRTSSMGRLFDGVAFLVSGVGRADYEGELGLMLETLCDHTESGSYEFPVETSDVGIEWLDWRPIIRQIVADIRTGCSAGIISARYHRAIARVVFRFVKTHHDLDTVLSGGCFQNRILTEWIREEAGSWSDRIWFPGTIPPNDGGLSVGQYVVATSQLFE